MKSLQVIDQNRTNDLTIYKERSNRLINLLVKKDSAELAKIGMEIMPSGKPDFEGIRNYPALQLTKGSGQEATSMNGIYLLIEDFCSSLNVKSNLSVEQMIECAGILFNDCGNYRLEDYYTMFEMAKRGKLGKVYERLDIEVLSNMKDAYDNIRYIEGCKILERKEQQRREMIEAQRIKNLSDSAINTTLDEKSIKQMFDIMNNEIKSEKQRIKEQDKQRKHEQFNAMRDHYAKINNVPVGQIKSSLYTSSDEDKIKANEHWIKSLNNRVYIKPKKRNHGKR